VLSHYIRNEYHCPDRWPFAYQISTAARAKEVVADSRFPPDGRRGFGSPFTPGIWNITPSQYLESANENILVMIQIENKEAVENVEEIASVGGIGERLKISSIKYND